MYSEFLNLCGFEPEEISREEERVTRAFRILEIGNDDVEKATKRVREFFDIGLLGMRKVLGVYVKELVDMVLAREEGKKIVYGSFPPISQLMAAMTSAAEDIYCVIPEVILCSTMNCIFDKMIPILEAAEKHAMPPGHALCAYLQTRLGAVVKGIIPVPDLLLPSCTLCDQSPKVDDLLHGLYGVPVVYADHIFDSGGEEWPTVINPRRVRYLATEIDKALEKFGEVFGYQVSEDMAREAIEREGRLFRVSSKLWELMRNEPVPIGFKDIQVATRVASLCTRRALGEGVEALQILYEELQNRVKDGFKAMEKGAPKVMASNLPFDPEQDIMFEDLGLNISVTTLAPLPSAHIQASYTSLWEQVAESIIGRRGARYSSLAYIFQIKELARLHHADGVILFHHIGCRQYNSWTLKAKQVIEEEIGVPVLLFEGDFCDYRHYNARLLKTNAETFAQIVKTEKASRKEIVNASRGY